MKKLKRIFSLIKNAIEKVLGLTDVKYNFYRVYLFLSSKNTDSYYYENLSTGYAEGLKSFWIAKV